MFGRDGVTFNILFVSGTVRSLAPFVLSILDASADCSIRLVSNGCTAHENQILESMASAERRLSFCRIETKRPLDHGVVLSLLQNHNESPVFAFMDSDIFATGDFLKELNWSPADSAGIFSCPPAWSNAELERLPQGYGILSGVYSQLHDGFNVGSSFFAMYDNKLLTQCMKETGITFQPYLWEQVPPDLQTELVETGKQMAFYDTGKLLNILLQLRYDASIEFRQCESLEHLGGISGFKLSRTRELYGLLQCAWSSVLPRGVRHLFRWAGMYNGWREMVSDAEARWVDARHSRRRQVVDYYSRLLRCLAENKMLGFEFEHRDAAMTRAVSRVADLLRDGYPGWQRRIRALVQTSQGAERRNLEPAQISFECQKAA
tara:strand:+ start:57901 stop:59028 length:1128 start_codon:yes stop_codon:yes gene_type:complete